MKNLYTDSQCLNFGKSVGDNAWGMFTTFLKYKLENEGKLLVKGRFCYQCNNKQRHFSIKNAAACCYAISHIPQSPSTTVAVSLGGRVSLTILVFLT